MCHLQRNMASLLVAVCVVTKEQLWYGHRCASRRLYTEQFFGGEYWRSCIVAAVPLGNCTQCMFRVDKIRASSTDSTVCCTWELGMSRGHRCASVVGMLGADRICTVLWWSVFGMSGSHRCAFSRHYTQSMFGVHSVSGSAVVFLFMFVCWLYLCVFFSCFVRFCSDVFVVWLCVYFGCGGVVVCFMVAVFLRRCGCVLKVCCRRL